MAHVGERALIVPFAGPGDRLRVRVLEASGRILRGRIESILEPSPARALPTCVHFGDCGGCHLQHVDRPAELLAKREFLRDCLRRIGGIRWDGEIAIESGEAYGWRSRVDLHLLRRPGERTRAAFHRAGSDELVPIEDCPVLVPALRRAVRALATGEVAPPPLAERLALVAGDGGEISATPPRNEAEPSRVCQRIGGFDFAVEPGRFFQANPGLAERLVERAVGGAHGSLAVDLYAGAGLFTLPLARRFDRVEAVESDAGSVRLGRDNAGANGIENARWIEQDVAGWLAGAGARLRPDLLLLDPPRAGAGRGVIPRMAALRPPAVAYVSCDPATLARDLRQLVELGYRVRRVAAVDMFPRSYHLESVVHLES